MWKGLCSKRTSVAYKNLFWGNLFLCQYCEKSITRSWVLRKQSQKVQTITKIRRSYKNFNRKMELYSNRICTRNELFKETIVLQYRLGAVKIFFCTIFFKTSVTPVATVTTVTLVTTVQTVTTVSTVTTFTALIVTYNNLFLFSSTLELLGSAEKIIRCMIHIKYVIWHVTLNMWHVPIFTISYWRYFDDF